MNRDKRLSVPRWCLLVAAVGTLAAGCSKHNEATRFIYRADEALTARSSSEYSVANRYRTADCREWRRFMGRKKIDERKWKFGCLNSATLVVSAADKRDLLGGRSLRPSEGWEAVKVLADDRKGTLDPGKTSTDKSATTRGVR
jgi:type IV pilus biogenesis protein CpaD/CtpE